MSTLEEQFFNKGWREGWREGWLKGWREGYEEGITRVAQAMLSRDCTFEFVQICTGLTPKQIRELADSLAQPAGTPRTGETA